MVRRIDGLADKRNAAGRAGGGFVVHHADCLDRVGLVFAQFGLERCRIGAAAPVGRDELGDDTQLGRHLVPQRGELAGLEHDYAIAGR